MAALAATLTVFVLAGCDNDVIKSWYDEDLAGDCEITAYEFLNPNAAGLISRKESGSAGDPITITITYPHGENIPSDRYINIVYTGVSVTPGGAWQPNSTGGGSVRQYTVRARNGAEKHYSVIATAGAGAGDCEITAYYFEAPAAVGTITGEGNGSKDTPFEIAITYPADSGLPANDDDIKAVHNGDSIDTGRWTLVGSGVHTRTYTVKAQDGTTKLYRVRAEGSGPVTPPSVGSLQAWLDGVMADVSYNGGGNYEYTLTKDDALEPNALSYSGYNVRITLTGGSAEKIISLLKTGTLFTVGTNVTLTLGGNVTLKGLTSNTASLVWVKNGGNLLMEAGSKITGNRGTASGGHAGGVTIDSSGTFTMNDGEISGNFLDYSCTHGGGVSVNGGTFTMNGGVISGNTGYDGGGVHVMSGIFIKTGGIIHGSIKSDGTAEDPALKNTATSGYGHAAYVNSSKYRNKTADETVELDSGSGTNWG
jgi:hypothetical protein